MTMNSIGRLRSICRIPIRQTHWVLKHVVPPPVTPEGGRQRPPTDLQDLQKYEAIKSPDEKPDYMIKVILLEDVEGRIGQQFDVLEVPHKTARETLLLPKKAVYASPFDLQYYGRLKEEMKEELERKVRIPYEYLKLGRELMAKLIAIHVSVDKKWQLNSEIVYTSLFENDIRTNPDAIFLPNRFRYEGPNFELEAALLRFYLVLDRTYVVPMLGRIAHISTDEQQQSLYPEVIQLPSKEQMGKFGIVPEQPYYHQRPIEENLSIVDLMKKRIE
ncbi:RIBOSOMAL-L9 domain-containing protein [Aphelenchoides besseyi]|nr:RIBOSOMAL-L9 domain-containing protein [Aphelenchoides besseyi]KAI6202451.1 RIBOSOMAL-L9 domain-containing protein [Aphelenchoides besseyi]